MKKHGVLENVTVGRAITMEKVKGQRDTMCTSE